VLLVVGGEVPVVDSKRQVLNLVTQSQVVRWLAEHVDALGAINAKTIKDCPRLFKKVSVRCTGAAIKARRQSKSIVVDQLR
jgi:hypothetical protein